MSDFSRRAFLLSTSAAAVGLATSLGSRAAASASTLQVTEQRAVRTAGTTLDTVATATGSGGYRRLTAGPGWPLIPRQDLVSGRADRDSRRTPLASVVQFTDLHLADSQSPMRFEYLHELGSSVGSGAFRPHETMSPLGAAALVQRVNELPGGPFTGRDFDALMSTGDNADNHETIELEWFLGVLCGGDIIPNTGDPVRYEGVQNSGSTLYWNPETALVDMYKKAGFPQIPGLLDAAIRQFHSQGLRIPWYSTFGNHDDSIMGTLPSETPVFREMYTGSSKIEGMPDGDRKGLSAALHRDRDARTATDIISRNKGIARRVTPDTRRKPLTPKEYIAAHLRPEFTGAGPVGHGYHENDLDAVTAYYTFAIAPGVLGISLDSTNRAGFTNGSLGTEQLEWLEKVLTANSSRYYDPSGTLVRQQVSDQLFLVFSHHTSKTMDNKLPDPGRPFERRHDGNEVVALLQRFPNVLAWVNGHTHMNEITPHGHAQPERGFWEVNTASHVDYPHHARIVEVADNGDGTLSLFTTLIESAAGYQTDFSDLSQAGLGSLYRELAFNDIHAEAARMGKPEDHNTELLLTNPLSTAALRG